MKKFIFVSLICLCFGLNVFAQAKIKVLKYEVPKYSLGAAMAIRAKGEVVVTVKIDKDGKVISSKYESGHGLFRKPSEEAAEKWLFSPNKNLEEREVKIIFDFRIKENHSGKNNYKPHKIKIFFKKPYRLVILTTAYPRIDV